jgi:hypothetical protein
MVRVFVGATLAAGPHRLNPDLPDFRIHRMVRVFVGAPLAVGPHCPNPDLRDLRIYRMVRVFVGAALAAGPLHSRSPFARVNSAVFSRQNGADIHAGCNHDTRGRPRGSPLRARHNTFYATSFIRDIL